MMMNDKAVEQMRDECSRHESEVYGIVGNTDLNRIRLLAEKVEDLKQERVDKRDELREVVYKVLSQLSSRQRVTLGKQLTIRDGKVFKYNQSKEVGLKKIAAQKHLFEEEDCITTDCKAFETIMNEIDNLNGLSRAGSWRKEKEIEKQASTSDAVIEDYTTVSYESRNTDRLVVSDGKSSYSGTSFSLHKKEKSPAKEYDGNLHKLRLLVAFKPQFIQVLEDAKKTFQEQIDRREAAKNSIKQNSSKELVAASL